MSTRSSTGSIPCKRDRDASADDNSRNDDNANNHHRQGQGRDQQQHDDSRDPHDCLDVSMTDKMGQQRDNSPPTPEQIARLVNVKTETRASHMEEKSNRKSPTVKTEPQDGPTTPINHHHDSSNLSNLALATTTSFDHMGPSNSFDGLSPLHCLGSVMSIDGTVTATNATPTNKARGYTPIVVAAPSNSGGRHGLGLGTPGRSPSGISTPGSHFRPTSSIPANMPMSELDNPSWDLLNQDSFGFNLLGSHGSLSFEMGEDTTGKKEIIIGGSGTKSNSSSSRKHGQSVDLTSAVTGSLDDTPTPIKSTAILESQHQWGSNPTIMGASNVVADTTVVNSMNHNWIPPHSPQPPMHHLPLPHYSHHPGHHHPSHHPSHPPSHPLGHPPSHHHPSHHPRHPSHVHTSHHPLQESRSDITHHHSYYGMNHNEMREPIDFEDPFKYAFGDPHSANPAPGNYSKHPSTYGKGQSKSGSRRSANGGQSGSGRNGGRTRTSGSGRPGSTSGSSSRRDKKRKHITQQEPLDGHHSPPPLPGIESAPTATLEMEMINPPHPDSWGNPANPETRRRSNSARNGSSNSARNGCRGSRRSNKHLHHAHPDISSSGRSSTWHGPPTGAPHSPYPPYPPPPIGADPIHSAFLPPMPAPPPSNSGAFHPPNGGPPNGGGSAPPREVYITTSNSNKPPQPRAGAPYPPPFVMHPGPGPPPPYNYPRAPSNPRSNPNAGPPPGNISSAPAPPRRNRNQPSAPQPPPPHQQQQQQPPPPQQMGLTLLTLPTGQTLSRSQAPGIGWPPAEDLRLTEVMSNHKSSQVNWDQLCLEHGMRRTARECHDRWTRYLKPGSRKGQWREEEDAIVLRVIFASGAGLPGSGEGNEGGPPFTQWADLAPQLPGRTGKQIRDRWVNYLNPAINHLPFSREDDLRLWSGHKELGKRWVEISVKIFHSTRSENHIKNRWYSAAFKKFIAKEFGMDAYVDAKQAQGGVVGSVGSSIQHSHAAAQGSLHAQSLGRVPQVHHHPGTRNGMLSLNDR